MSNYTSNKSKFIQFINIDFCVNKIFLFEHKEDRCPNDIRVYFFRFKTCNSIQRSECLCVLYYTQFDFFNIYNM